MECLSTRGKLQVLRDRINALEHAGILSGNEEEVVDLLDRLLMALLEQREESR